MKSTLLRHFLTYVAYIIYSFVKGSSRYYKQQSYQSYPNSQSHPNHQSYPCPSSFNPSDTRTLREILDHTPPQNLQDEVAKYVLRKNWNIYVSLRDK